MVRMRIKKKISGEEVNTMIINNVVHNPEIQNLSPSYAGEKGKSYAEYLKFGYGFEISTIKIPFH